jgi:sarcosine oxidase subunit gamma
MSEPEMKRNELDELPNIDHSDPPVDNSNLVVRINPDRNYFNLRGNASERAFLEAIKTCTGLELPQSANTFTELSEQQGLRIFWLGPDEWLIEAQQTLCNQLLTDLGQALKGLHHSLIDISGGNICLSLSGDMARYVLAKGCSLDLHFDVFKNGDCAQTSIGKASVLLALTTQPALFDLIVRRSFVEYLMMWLQQSGKEFDIDFSEAWTF